MNLPEKGERLTTKQVAAICMEYGRWELAARVEAVSPAKLFVCDGASCFPDQLGEVDLYPAAFFHDIRYWLGGSYWERLIADSVLAIDVKKQGGSATLVAALFIGVRIGRVQAAAYTLEIGVWACQMRQAR